MGRLELKLQDRRNRLHGTQNQGPVTQRPRSIKRTYGTNVCRYNWHSAGSLDRLFPMLKYNYIFRIKYTNAVLSNSTRKLLWFEISTMLIAVYKNKFIVSFKSGLVVK